MNEPQEIECVVIHRAFPYPFEAKLQVSHSKAGRKIDKEFYDTHSNGGFDGTHIEIELITDVAALKNSEKIHFHRGGGGKAYVCWTQHVLTMEEATKLFRAWCVGTAYTIEIGEDFGQIFRECGCDHMQFLRRMEIMGFTIEETEGLDRRMAN